MHSENQGIHKTSVASWASDSRLAYTCDACQSAFDASDSHCPYCGAARPAEGWPRTESRPDPWLGRLLDKRYRLVRRLGRGATGAVYRASRPHVDGAWAIKLIATARAGQTADLAGRSLRERVEREVRILSSIPNPHVVDFQDLLELPGDILAVVMDYVDGATLGTVIDSQSPLEIERAIRIGADIASGLRDIHARGVVHRDLKPDNVMLHEPDTDREFAEIIDFGIARFEGEAQQTIGFIGTPRYTSPEQARGQRAGPPGDIYNLGLLLHHMLIGEAPFCHDEIDELLAAHSSDDAPRLGDCDAEREFPERLEDLVASMLAKAPSERPESMETIIQTLRSVADDLEARRTEGGSTTLGDTFSGRDFDSPLSGYHHRPAKSDVEVHPDSFSDEFRHISDVAPDGRQAFLDENNAVRVRSPSGSEEAVVFEPSRSVTALSCKSSHLLMGHSNGYVAAVDLDTFELTPLLEERPGTAASAVAEAQNSGLIVIGFEGGNVLFRTSDADGFVWRHVSDGPAVRDLAIQKDGCVAVARSDRSVEVYNLSVQSREAGVKLQLAEDIDEVELCPDGYLLAVRTTDGTIDVFETVEGESIATADRDEAPSNTADIFNEVD